MKKIHIDDGNGNALCGLRVRAGEERGYCGNNPDHPDTVLEGAVYEVIVQKAHGLSDCGSSKRCLNCCRKFKKINGFD